MADTGRSQVEQESFELLRKIVRTSGKATIAIERKHASSE